ncbi:penicillin-binding transpeptidase domain-containing protein [Anaerocolumna jejuensis]|uniref:penicillin-binding transpeptidase domain-containing protein n=1 Tax=Anaerocolumna jejuensis TaxID=259063 RepID=UPI003F7BC13D
MKQKSDSIRLVVIGAIFLVLILWLVVDLYKIQITGSGQSAGFSDLKSKKDILLESTRGNIYDRNGKILATNRASYRITIEDSGNYDSNKEHQNSLNRIAEKLAKVLNENGETIRNALMITLDSRNNYSFTASGTRLSRLKSDVFGRARASDMSQEEASASAEDIINYLCNRFAVSNSEKEYTKAELLAALTIRYMLWLNSYQKYLPVTVATDVTEQTAAEVLENSDILKGVKVETGSVRVYEGGEAFSHILGYTGAISTEELEAAQKAGKNYSIDTVVGKDGIEKSMDEALQGSNGLKEVAVNQTGRIQNVLSVTDPVPGKDVYLSIDKDLQIAAYQILEQHIAGVLLSNIINAREFNKSSLKDSSDIRIPVYDVYCALVKNNILNISPAASSKSSDLEKSISQRFQAEKKAVLHTLEENLTVNARNYNDLPKETREYESYIVNELLQSGKGILSADAPYKEDGEYAQWTAGKISLKEYVMYALEKNWIDMSSISSSRKYVDIQEACTLVAEEILKRLKEDKEFDKLIYIRMIKNDMISGKEICELLYVQGILSPKDSDYQLLKDGQLSPYEFIRKKIRNLKITPAQLALEPCSGSVVLAEASTGKLLACVSYPGYDNNRLANQADGNYYSQLLTDLSLPLYNRATQQLTAPGSTFKPITIAAGIEESVISPNTSIYCDGVFDKLSPPLRCWKRSGHGEITSAAAAIQNSCNDYLCDISYRLGSKGNSRYVENQALTLLQKYAKLFHLDQKTGIEITESQPHITDTLAIPSAIGQGTHNYTTLQLEAYVNTIANTGTSCSLSLLDKIQDPGTGKAEKVPSSKKGEVNLSDAAWNTIHQGMLLFAQNNNILKDMKISIAGKTGTAQEAKTRPNHALFIGYTPSENPKYSITVRIANGYYSSNAVSTGKDIINYYLGLEDKKTLLNGKASEASSQRTD